MRSTFLVVLALALAAAVAPAPAAVDVPYPVVTIAFVEGPAEEDPVKVLIGLDGVPQNLSGILIGLSKASVAGKTEEGVSLLFRRLNRKAEETFAPWAESAIDRAVAAGLKGFNGNIAVQVVTVTGDGQIKHNPLYEGRPQPMNPLASAKAGTPGLDWLRIDVGAPAGSTPALPELAPLLASAPAALTTRAAAAEARTLLDRANLSGDALRSTVTGVEMFRKLLPAVDAGLRLRGIDKKDIRRLAAAGEATEFAGKVRVATGDIDGDGRVDLVFTQPLFQTGEFAGENPLFEEEGDRLSGVLDFGQPGGLLVETTARMADPAPDRPKESTYRLINPIAMDKGLRFAIREGGRTVGAGQVTEILK